MKNLWYSTKRVRGRVTNAARLSLVVGLVLSAVTVFAGTPDWLKQAAQTQLPVYPDDPDSVVLLDDTVTTVSAQGDIRTTHRRAYKILRPAGSTKGIVSVYFDSETELTSFKAWSITAKGEEYEVKEKEAIETAAFSEGLYEDTRYKLLQIPGAQPGSVIGYEYQQRQRAFVLQALWLFQQEIPVRRAKFSLELPPNWRYSAYWRNHSIVAPQSSEKRWTWELADIDAIPSEPQMPTWRSVAGTMGISFGSGDSLSSWPQIGRWYALLSSASSESTPSVRDKVREVVAGTSDPIEKVRRVAWYVQHGIRYVAIEIGIGGYKPHDAKEVLAGGYGDCKDKATLLKAMLREIGIDSYYVLINADRDFVNPDFPSLLDFNHVILGVSLSRDAVMQEAYASVLNDKVGRLLLFDPTDDTTPLGYLPPNLQSTRGLLVTSSDGELITTPLLLPSVNRLLREATLSLDNSGTLKGTIQEVRSGASATVMREALLNVPSNQRQRVFQDTLADLIDGAVLTGAATSDLQDWSKTLGLKYEFTAPGYAQRVGKLLVFRSNLLGRRGRTLLEGKTRKNPVEFSYAAREGDVVDISLPPEYALEETPEPVMFDFAFATYKSEIQVAEHSLRHTRSYEIKDVRIPVERLDDLKGFFRQISDDEQAYTILKMR